MGMHREMVGRKHRIVRWGPNRISLALKERKAVQFGVVSRWKYVTSCTPENSKCGGSA